ncbi:MAG: glucose 1-dehydrogenase [Acidobacteria bacterium]|nr:glucose 1-dehydrogenase [Acidobacteriota bacterium]
MAQEAKSAIVTGAGRGIGRAIALKLAQSSYKRVAVFDILGDNAQAVTKEIEALGGEAIAVAVDLTKCQQVQNGVAEVVAKFGQIDLLVNNAGWDKLELFLDSEEATWEKVISINFKSVLLMCRTVVPHMVARGSGKVVSIASDAGRVGSMGEAVYSGTKGAIIAFSKSLAREMARHKISVNVVCPGLTETPLLQGIRDQSEKAHKVIDAVTRAIPFGRVGTPEEIANAVAFFASSEADFVTGQTLSVSGGLTMC